MHESAQYLIMLSTICFCALVAHRIRIAAPIAFLLGGGVLTLVPGMSHIRIDPEYMMVLFLPPILMETAFFTSIRDFRNSLRPILLLAIGLVALTAATTAAVVVGMLPNASWALGFLIGAIVSPPDAAAATASLKGVQIPKRVMTILEGESLVNDATGIVLYKFALGAMLASTFSLVDVSADFAWKAAGGIGIGLAIALIFVKLYPLLKEPPAEIIASFIPPYAAYVLAEHFHASGVLAVVATGLLIGWHAPSIFLPKARMPMEAVWRMLVYMLNAFAFLLIGLQLPMIFQGLQTYNLQKVFLLTAVICLSATMVRFAYVFAVTYLFRWLFPNSSDGKPLPPWQNVVVIAWTGMRGVVTLALALGVPLTLADGSHFPYRDLILFIGTSMILFTLVLQGITLPWLTEKLAFSYDPQRLQEEWLARVQSTRRVLNILNEVTDCEDVHRPALERIRQHYEERLQSLGDGPNTPIHAKTAPSLMDHPLLQAENRIWHVALNAERETVIALRRDFTISDDVMNDILREVDLLANRFHYTGEAEDEEIPLHEQKRRLWQRLRGKVA